MSLMPATVGPDILGDLMATHTGVLPPRPPGMPAMMPPGTIEALAAAKAKSLASQQGRSMPSETPGHGGEPRGGDGGRATEAPRARDDARTIPKGQRTLSSGYSSRSRHSSYSSSGVDTADHRQGGPPARTRTVPVAPRAAQPQARAGPKQAAVAGGVVGLGVALLPPVPCVVGMALSRYVGDLLAPKLWPLTGATPALRSCGWSALIGTAHGYVLAVLQDHRSAD